MKIKVTCKAADYVGHESIKDFQGQLKTISESNLQKLKREIGENGFNSAVDVWKSGKTLWNLDGHQRLAAVRSLAEEGYEIPLIPINYVQCKNKKQAKHILLSRISQYGKVKESGFAEYITDAGLDISDMKDSFDIPNIDFAKIDNQFINPEPKKDDVSAETSGESFSTLLHQCPECGHKFGKKKTILRKKS